jgi:hypothetical protein
MSEKLTKAEQEQMQGYFDAWAARVTRPAVERLIARFDRHIADARARREALDELLGRMERDGIGNLLDVAEDQRYVDACDENWFLYGGRASAEAVAT